MKSKVWICILAGLLLLSAGAGIFLLLPSQPATHVQIFSAGNLVAEVDLGRDQEIAVASPGGGENVVTVQAGKIAVTAATCPDHYCMKRGFCNSGAQIVCLPNRLEIRFVGEQEIDGAVG